MNGDIFKELLIGYTVEELAKSLENETDEPMALRQALLFLTFLSQEQTDPGQKRFIEFLLTRFPGLLKGLKQHRVPFLFDTWLKIVRDKDDTIMVVIPQQYIEKAGNAVALMPDNTLVLPRNYYNQVKERYPFSEWQALGRRDIGFFDHMGFKNTVAGIKEIMNHSMTY